MSRSAHSAIAAASLSVLVLAPGCEPARQRGAVATAEVTPSSAPPAPASIASSGPEEPGAGSRAPVPARAGAALEWLRAVRSGAVPPERAFDRRKGVAFVQSFEDPSGEDPHRGADGNIESAALLCGPGAVLERVRTALDRGASFGVTCDEAPPASAPSCTFQGMEGTPAIRVVLRGDASGLEIAAIVEISEDTTMAPAWVARARAWVDERLRDLAKRRCP
jgi:hypothetical protein